MFKIGDNVTFKKNFNENPRRKFLFNPRDIFNVLNTGTCPCGKSQTVTLGAHMRAPVREAEWFASCCPNEIIVEGEFCNIFLARDVEKVVEKRSYVVDNVEVSLEVNPN